MDFVMCKIYKNESGIYKINNLINGKFYIGSTVNFYNRYRVHVSTLQNKKHDNSYLQRSINKYGLNNFTFSVVELCEADQLERIEAAWLSKSFGSNCYNLNKSVEVRNMNARFNKNYSLISPDNILYNFYGNVADFSRMLTMIDSSISCKTFEYAIRRLLKGEIIHFRGWRLTENKDVEWENIPINRRKIYNGKKYNVMLLAPSGEIVGPIINIEKFCKKYNLCSAGNVHRLINNKIPSYKGWTILGTGNHLKTRNAKNFDVIIIDPDGNEYGPIYNLTKFAREHNVNITGLQQLVKKNILEYKKWRIK